MDLFEVVRRDRATRAFTDEPIADETVEALVDAARPRRSSSGRVGGPSTSCSAGRPPDRAVSGGSPDPGAG